MIFSMDVSEEVEHCLPQEVEGHIVKPLLCTARPGATGLKRRHS